MEMLWPVLAVMIPLFIGGVIVLAMYWGRDPVTEGGSDPSAPRVRSAGSGRGGRRRLPTGSVAIALYLTAGLALGVVAAAFVGFPILRSLLMVVHAPIEPG